MEAPQRGREPAILVVDDEPRVARLIRHTPGPAGFRVMDAPDGPSGIAALKAGEPDLVLLDVIMPGIDGNEVCRRIRAFSDVPIIMLTGLGREADRIRGLEMGADDYVVKPFSPNELVARVRALRQVPAPQDRARARRAALRDHPAGHWLPLPPAAKRVERQLDRFGPRS